MLSTRGGVIGGSSLGTSIHNRLAYWCFTFRNFANQKSALVSNNDLSFTDGQLANEEELLPLMARIHTDNLHRLTQNERLTILGRKKWTEVSVDGFPVR